MAHPDDEVLGCGEEITKFTSQGMRVNIFGLLIFQRFCHKNCRLLEAYNEEMRAFPHAKASRVIAALAQWRDAMVGVTAEAFVFRRQIL
jgi:hypothetical protein